MSEEQQDQAAGAADDRTLRWIVAVVAITLAWTLGYWVAQFSGASRLPLSASLPHDYRATINALLASAGTPCRDTCGFTIAEQSAGGTTFYLTCRTSTRGCAQPATYMLTLRPAPEPSR